jgi:uncharacterized membrane protein HdeD (DUF308 family)
MKPIARHWWVFLLIGILNVIVGAIAIAHPGFTLLALGIVLGIYLLLAAITAIVEGITGTAESRATSIIIGVVALIAALICLRRPGESLLAIIVVVGIYLVAAGFVNVVLAFALPSGRGPVLLVGALQAALGILILALPDVSLGTLAILAGIAMVIRGVFDIVAAFGIRRLRDTDAARPVPPPGAGLAT